MKSSGRIRKNKRINQMRRIKRGKIWDDNFEIKKNKTGS